MDIGRDSVVSDWDGGGGCNFGCTNGGTGGTGGTDANDGTGGTGANDGTGGTGGTGDNDGNRYLSIVIFGAVRDRPDTSPSIVEMLSNRLDSSPASSTLSVNFLSIIR